MWTRISRALGPIIGKGFQSLQPALYRIQRKTRGTASFVREIPKIV
jgi:hypothetical protein